jgi:phosphatidylinositol kinase/protein kinase (PI-3  family)
MFPLKNIQFRNHEINEIMLAYEFGSIQASILKSSVLSETLNSLITLIKQSISKIQNKYENYLSNIPSLDLLNR